MSLEDYVVAVLVIASIVLIIGTLFLAICSSGSKTEVTNIDGYNKCVMMAVTNGTDATQCSMLK